MWRFTFFLRRCDTGTFSPLPIRQVPRFPSPEPFLLIFFPGPFDDGVPLWVLRVSYVRASSTPASPEYHVVFRPFEVETCPRERFDPASSLTMKLYLSFPPNIFFLLPKLDSKKPRLSVPRDSTTPFPPPFLEKVLFLSATSCFLLPSELFPLTPPPLVQARGFSSLSI